MHLIERRSSQSPWLIIVEIKIKIIDISPKYKSATLKCLTSLSYCKQLRDRDATVALSHSRQAARLEIENCDFYEKNGFKFQRMSRLTNGVMSSGE